MPATVVAHQRALVLGQGIEVGEHVFYRTVRPRGSLERGVEAGDVALVVLVVVETHRQLVDGGFQCGVRIWKRWQCVRHGTSVTRLGTGSHLRGARCESLVRGPTDRGPAYARRGIRKIRLHADDNRDPGVQPWRYSGSNGEHRSPPLFRFSDRMVWWRRTSARSIATVARRRSNLSSRSPEPSRRRQCCELPSPGLLDGPARRELTRPQRHGWPWQRPWPATRTVRAASPF